MAPPPLLSAAKTTSPTGCGISHCSRCRLRRTSGRSRRLTRPGGMERRKWGFRRNLREFGRMTTRRNSCLTSTRAMTGRAQDGRPGSGHIVVVLVVVVVVVVRARMMRTKRRPLPRCISPAVRIRRSRSLSASSKGRISQGSSGQCAWGPERACVLTRMFRSSGAQPGSTRGAWNCSRTRRAAKLRHLRAVLSHLEAYLNRFQNVLGAGNRRYIQTLTVLTRSFLRCLISNEDCSSAVTSMTINKFLFSFDIDNINIVKLCQYLKESNIVHKVSGYANKLFITENGVCNLNHGQQHGEGSSITSFQALTDLLRSLLYCNDDGRIIVARHKPGGQPEDAYIKFVMLCAEKTFSEVTDDAHVVIMAGGTLQPIEETRLRLFPGLLPSDIKFFSCNHIVPPESILPIAVTCGPSGKKFDFSHSSRSSLNMIEELGRFLCNIVTIVPEGIVMFFSSYEYEKQVYDAWMASGTISKISKKKHVFREPRSSVDVEVILNKYKEAIQSCSKGSGDTSVNGALLLAVVGGKISEGINFSDGMGRCVLMVGLPYPSPDDIELMETIKHIGNYSTSSVIGDDKPFNGNDECKLEPGFDVLRKSGKSGREYYENLCMKAVNQSIGRAIRHVNDYAAMLLVDSRYAHTS
ncbi:hypothetical protein VPH35_013790 [Triticum aestivum]